MRHQRDRFKRPDAHRYIRPDVYRFMPPSAPRRLGKNAVDYFWPESTMGYSTPRFERKYDPDQPRVPAGNTDGGQWTSTAAVQLDDSEFPAPTPTAMSKNAICEAQWLTDSLICKIAKSRACWAQAMVRLVACENGTSIPPLNY
jgi:hypothetical protein